MNDERHFETLLRDALGRTGKPAPFAVDVTHRVMARIGELGPQVRAEIGAGQFIRWAVAASLVGLGLLGVAAWRGPGLHELVSAFGHAMAAATGTSVKLSTLATTLAATLGRVGHALVDSAQTLASPLVSFQPLARALLVVVAAAMLGITAYVVGRDVRVGTPSQKEIR